ncbi:MAG: hypothetical protein IKK57_04885 [Clostridia bacterium]|nr:hypothetical protein [Clostridia bacterium]
MDIKFHCPHMNRMITSEECYDAEEFPCCERCTSEMDTKRKALCDWLRATYSDRYAITMETDGVGIVVHDHLRVLADPCDETADTYLGVYCGDAGDTHCHPFDMQQDVASLLEGRTVIGLIDGEFYSSMTQRGLYEQEPDRLSEWDHLVDAEGIYTPEEYAAKLGVTLPQKELYFDCSKLCRRISESECRKRCGGLEEPCRKCDLTPMNRAAVEHVSIELLRARTTQVKILQTRGGLCVRVHPELELEFVPDGLTGDCLLGVKAKGRVSMHSHPAGEKALADLEAFLRGEKVLLLGRMLVLGEWSSFVTTEELREKWDSLTRGRWVWIADLRGVWDKKTYLAHMNGERDARA